MFQIKICGITRTRDGIDAIQAGADAIGLNFYEASSRAIDLSRATEIAAAARAVPLDSVRRRINKVTVVGVFVNASTSTIEETARTVGLDLIQLHGDESTDQLRSLAPRRCFRAIRVKQEDDDQLATVDDELSSQSIEGALVDAYSSQEYGGTGRVADWALAARLVQRWQPHPTILAGGLTSANVRDAIVQVRPFGVDTASGVESKPGIKDPKKIAAFVDAAISGFQGLTDD